MKTAFASVVTFVLLTIAELGGPQAQDHPAAGGDLRGATETAEVPVSPAPEAKPPVELPASQGKVRGRVVGWDGNGIAGAKVTLEGDQPVTGETGEDGWFELSAKVGAYRALKVEKQGFTSASEVLQLEIAGGESVELAEGILLKSIPTPTPTPKMWEERRFEATLRLPGGAEVVFAAIPGGSFRMGSPRLEDGHAENETPLHQVTVQPFWLGKYEVTQAQWEALMGSNPSRFRASNLPVVGVWWNDCQEFLTKLNSMVSGGGFRLPSEAEWEYACRAGSTTCFCFGDRYTDLGAYGWYRGNSGGRAHPVGQKNPNAWGLYDMHGNVWEWCQDWYHTTYNRAPANGSAWERPAGSERVLRGGSRYDAPEACRSASRSGGVGWGGVSTSGFRLARTVY